LFSFFKRKPTLTDVKRRELVEAIAGLLAVQLAVVPEADRKLKDSTGKFRKKALGYVHGCTDAIVTTKGYEMSDTEIGMPITLHVLRQLFPKEDAAKSLEYLVANQRDQTVGVGMMIGGQQTVDFLNGKWRAGGAAMGLARILLKGDDEE
jgi:hypothetical protein